MKKTIFLSTLLMVCTFIISCGSDDDAKSIELSGTSWIGTGSTSSARSITFISDTNYNYTEPGGGPNGTYTFNGSSGVLTDNYGTIPFYVNNDLLTIDYDGGTGGYIDTNGKETFIRQ